MTMTSVLIGLALRGAPRHLRDTIHGDLLEQRGGAREALLIALHYQAEPYRDGTDRRHALVLTLAAAGLLWIVPMAAQSLLVQAAVFEDAFSRAALRIWSAPNLWAAVACGLLLGRASFLPEHADATRLHLLLILAPAAALVAPGTSQALLAAGLMSTAAWLGHQNRQARGLTAR